MDEKLMDYRQWKKNIPVCYDFFINNNLILPSPCIRWGHAIREDSTSLLQRIYYTERGAEPNTIVIANVRINKPRTTDPSKMDRFDENLPAEQVRVVAKIETPCGAEVNSLLPLPQHPHVLVAKSDLSALHLLDLSAYAAAAAAPEAAGGEGGAAAEGARLAPVASLEGHAEGACESSFAMDVSSTGGRVVSGDRKGTVLLWDVAQLAGAPAGGGAGGGRVDPVLRLAGHELAVEDVCFEPGSQDVLCSVGDDGRLALWDVRAADRGPAARVAVHGAGTPAGDIHTVDWNSAEANLLVTGAADGSILVFDRRRLSAGPSSADGGGGPPGADEAYPLHRLQRHTEAVYRVAWRPGSRDVFGSGGDDSGVLLWDLARLPPADGSGGAGGDGAEILLRHGGHRGSVQDLQWNPLSEWCVASVSEDAGTSLGGGTLQVWRPSDLGYRSDAEVIADIAALQDMLRA